ncbi:hypothetical protein [Halobacillus litoralis]|uniref:hypothetical protein n=1 Tax=Halobacillus litoralis TaxID=45668 RepID=UPI001CD573E8|nr:hypothetical protein [Halobacillus litoralis]MCA1021563.1 hypothetical protein [Halobacillus litoralis]
MVRILEYKYRGRGEHLRDTDTRLSEFKSFEEYLNLIAVGKTGMPKYYKTLSRSFDPDKKEVLFKIHDDIENKSYKIFAKVVE